MAFVVDYWKNLVLQVDSWINIYRENVFVGTEMGLRHGMNLVHNDVPDKELNFQEFNINDDGHVHYWTDIAVLKEVGQLFDECGYKQEKKIPIKLKKVMEPKACNEWS